MGIKILESLEFMVKISPPGLSILNQEPEGKVSPGISIFDEIYTPSPPSLTGIRSDQIRSVTQSCPTLCDPMNRSTPGLSVHHQLPELTETHVH